MRGARACVNVPSCDGAGQQQSASRGGCQQGCQHIGWSESDPETRNPTTRNPTTRNPNPHTSTSQLARMQSLALTPPTQAQKTTPKRAVSQTERTKRVSVDLLHQCIVLVVSTSPLSLHRCTVSAPSLSPPPHRPRLPPPPPPTLFRLLSPFLHCSLGELTHRHLPGPEYSGTYVHTCPPRVSQIRRFRETLKNWRLQTPTTTAFVSFLFVTRPFSQSLEVMGPYPLSNT